MKNEMVYCVNCGALMQCRQTVLRYKAWICPNAACPVQIPVTGSTKQRQQILRRWKKEHDSMQTEQADV